MTDSTSYGYPMTFEILPMTIHIANAEKPGNNVLRVSLNNPITVSGNQANTFNMMLEIVILDVSEFRALVGCTRCTNTMGVDMNIQMGLSINLGTLNVYNNLPISFTKNLYLNIQSFNNQSSVGGMIPPSMFVTPLNKAINAAYPQSKLLQLGSGMPDIFMSNFTIDPRIDNNSIGVSFHMELENPVKLAASVSSLGFGLAMANTTLRFNISSIDGSNMNLQFQDIMKMNLQVKMVSSTPLGTLLLSMIPNPLVPVAAKQQSMSIVGPFDVLTPGNGNLMGVLSKNMTIPLSSLTKNANSTFLSAQNMGVLTSLVFTPNNTGLLFMGILPALTKLTPGALQQTLGTSLASIGM